MSVFWFRCPYAAFVAIAMLSAACRTASLPPATVAYLPSAALAQRAPICGSAPIKPRPSDATATYFACQVDQAILPAADAVLRYPGLLAGANVEGIVELQFAVDPSGAVDTTSIVVLQSTHDLFTSAARQALRGWSWQPAMRAGVAVRQLTTYGFCFQLVTEGANKATPLCELEPRYAFRDVLRACENEQATARACTDGGCATPAPPRPRPLSRCP